MAKTRGDFLDTSKGQVVGKSQTYVLLVDSAGNAILDAGGNEQIAELQSVGGRLKVDASITGSLTKLSTEPDPPVVENGTLLIIDKTDPLNPTSTVKVGHNGIWEAF